MAILKEVRAGKCMCCAKLQFKVKILSSRLDKYFGYLYLYFLLESLTVDAFLKIPSGLLRVLGYLEKKGLRTNHD